VALAARNEGDVKPPGWRLIMGEIIAVEQDQFIVMNRGEEITLNVNDNSRFWTPAEGEVGSDLLEVAGWMVGFAQNDE